MTSREEFKKEYFREAEEQGYPVDTQIFMRLEDQLYIKWLEKKVDDLTEALDCSLDDVAYFKGHLDRLEADNKEMLHSLALIAKIGK
jgi:hypothetical protein